MPGVLLRSIHLRLTKYIRLLDWLADVLSDTLGTFIIVSFSGCFFGIFSVGIIGFLLKISLSTVSQRSGSHFVHLRQIIDSG